MTFTHVDPTPEEARESNPVQLSNNVGNEMHFALCQRLDVANYKIALSEVHIKSFATFYRLNRSDLNFQIIENLNKKMSAERRKYFEDIFACQKFSGLASDHSNCSHPDLITEFVDNRKIVCLCCIFRKI